MAAMSDLVTSQEYDQQELDAMALERAHDDLVHSDGSKCGEDCPTDPLRGAGEELKYHGYKLERRYGDRQIDSLLFWHEEYNGPPDRRVGSGRDVADVCAQIDEQIRDREEMECAG